MDLKGDDHICAVENSVRANMLFYLLLLQIMQVFKKLMEQYLFVPANVFLLVPVSLELPYLYVTYNKVLS